MRAGGESTAKRPLPLGTRRSAPRAGPASVIWCLSLTPTSGAPESATCDTRFRFKNQNRRWRRQANIKRAASFIFLFSWRKLIRRHFGRPLFSTFLVLGRFILYRRNQNVCVSPHWPRFKGRTVAAGHRPLISPFYFLRRAACS